jgi:hypothetical protein
MSLQAIAAIPSVYMAQMHGEHTRRRGCFVVSPRNDKDGEILRYIEVFK